jgi:hypothetical protein
LARKKRKLKEGVYKKKKSSAGTEDELEIFN